jgi:copper resistance protein C
MKRSLQGFALLLVAASSTTTASAHAVLDGTVPAARSTVHGSPKDVALKFTQRLEPAFSSVAVFDADGRQVDDRRPKVDAADATTLRVTLPPLPSGRYRVSWRVLSVDTHVSKGEYTFDVAP